MGFFYTFFWHAFCRMPSNIIKSYPCRLLRPHIRAASRVEIRVSPIKTQKPIGRSVTVVSHLVRAFARHKICEVREEHEWSSAIAVTAITNWDAQCADRHDDGCLSDNTIPTLINKISIFVNFPQNIHFFQYI